MSAVTRELHGLRVRSELPLEGRPASGAPDIDVRVETDGAQSAARGGDVLACVEDDDYSLTRTETDAYAIRFGEDFEYRFSSRQRTIDVRLLRPEDRELASILLAGSVLSCVLTLEGACVLHASAVELDGSTIALAGASGMGKSTLTALLCAAGARLVSDDALRLEATAGGAECLAGTSLIRLRPSAACLAGLFPADAVAPTADGRIAVRAEPAAGSRFTLGAILIPRPDRDASALQVERLRARDALVQLLRYPRMFGWNLIEPTQRLFDVLAHVSERVPVFEVIVPWGPPFDERLANRILAEIGVMAARRPVEVPR